MAFLTMIITIPLLFLALKHRSDKENFLKLKIFSIWLLCQMYLWLNDKYRIPLGILTALIVVANNDINRRSKFVAFLIGILSFSMSIGIHILYNI